MNNCVFMGTITAKEIKFTPANGNKKAFIKFSISIYDGKDQNGQATYYFVDLVAFGKTAEMIGSKFTNKSPICVTCKYTPKTSETDGKKYYNHDFVINNVNFIPNAFNEGGAPQGQQGNPNAGTPTFGGGTQQPAFNPNAQPPVFNPNQNATFNPNQNATNQSFPNNTFNNNNFSNGSFPQTNANGVPTMEVPPNTLPTQQ